MTDDQNPAIRDVPSDPETIRQEPPLDHVDRIGTYQAIRQMGRGGMGTVYLATRVDGDSEQYFALKIIKRGMDTDEIITRFRRERQILAKLDHPNIAKFIDGGTTDNGLPYFVMEFIQGEPLQEYCNARRLGIDSRIRLFLDICAAVEYAHRNLIVHRDLKPGNILITQDGIPKLLDFGIAKFLDAERQQHDASTFLSDSFLTPEYASPEQVRGESISTATDLYSLGVILYELLTGVRPYRFTNRQPDAIQKIICEEVPEKLSSVVMNDEYALKRVGFPLGAERLKRVLRGDLDNIVLVALRKEPSSRYPSVEALSDDLRRYLGRLPVRVQSLTLGYRISKFIGRNKAAVFSAALIFVLVALFGVMMAIQSARLTQERDAAERERDKSRTIAGFLINLFEVSDPNEAKGDKLTARELLDRGASKITTELRDQPEVRASLMATMARVYTNLGLYDRADVLLKESLKIRRSIHPPNDLDVAESLNILGDLYRLQGNYNESLAAYEEELSLHRKTGDELKIAGSLNNVGLGYVDKGDFETAEPYLLEALAMHRRLLPHETVQISANLNNLALMYHGAGDFKKAEPLFKEALAIEEKIFGNNHLQVAITLNNLALLYQDSGDYMKAEPMYRRSLEIRREVLGRDNMVLSVSLGNLGSLLTDMGENNQAEVLLRNALEIDRKISGESAIVATDLQNLAKVLKNKKHYQEAEQLCRESLALRHKLLGQDHPDVASSLSTLGIVIREQGRAAEAEQLFRESLQLRTKIFGKNHPATARTQAQLAEALFDQKRISEAEQLLRESIVIQENSHSTSKIDLEIARSALANCLAARREFIHAERLFIGSYQSLVAIAGPRNPSALETARRIVKMYEAWGKTDKANAYLTKLPPG
jgi:serine/threonine-protein kinase